MIRAGQAGSTAYVIVGLAQDDLWDLPTCVLSPWKQRAAGMQDVGRSNGDKTSLALTCTRKPPAALTLQSLSSATPSARAELVCSLSTCKRVGEQAHNASR
jgi:hypothetical protein